MRPVIQTSGKRQRVNGPPLYTGYLGRPVKRPRRMPTLDDYFRVLDAQFRALPVRASWFHGQAVYTGTLRGRMHFRLRTLLDDMSNARGVCIRPDLYGPDPIIPDLNVRAIGSGPLEILFVCASPNTTAIVSCIRLTDPMALQLCGHPRLQTISFSECSGLTDAGALSLAQCPNLADIHIRGCVSLSLTGIQAFSACPALRTLSLTGCSGYGSQAMAAVARAPGLTRLDLRTNTLSSRALMKLGACSTLCAVNLGSSPFINDAVVAGLVAGAPHLAAVDFGWCHGLTDGALTTLGECASLRGLHMSNCRGLTGAGVKVLIYATGSRLHDIDFSGLPIPEELMTAVALKCPNLYWADFSGCAGLTDATVGSLLRECPNLGIIGAIGCPSLTEAGYARLAKRLCAKGAGVFARFADGAFRARAVEGLDASRWVSCYVGEIGGR